jgi:hypothetical protein
MKFLPFNIILDLGIKPAAPKPFILEPIELPEDWNEIIKKIIKIPYDNTNPYITQPEPWTIEPNPWITQPQPWKIEPYQPWITTPYVGDAPYTLYPLTTDKPYTNIWYGNSKTQTSTLENIVGNFTSASVNIKPKNPELLYPMYTVNSLDYCPK